ncbi:two-component sensor histidine kinase [Bifidobacterium primatium]|uniref:Sensor histidine kinase MtrB n=1 Tax=Bifidobacterium primatium TaxID=2045438 RepID=A0A2M9H6W9_9BIFI|nr:MtrAB system histidine kinase MtrB [Bifidobacterium primatium]PJM72549.1 two-component sensor histidine kinase [Bifidobacterium primatium]
MRFDIKALARKGNPFLWLFRRMRSSVRRSLQRRVIVSTVLLSLVVACVFSAVSIFSVRSSLLNQASEQAQRDFTESVQRAQTNLDSSDVSARSDYQHLVTDLASTLQSEGSSNLLGVYLVGEAGNSDSIIPVSTDPQYLSLISESMRNQVNQSNAGSIFYQPVGYSRDDDSDLPGAILGSSLTMPDGNQISLFAAYSYEAQQRSVMSIQITLLSSVLVLSVAIGILIWRVLRGIIRPVESVAVAAEYLSEGNRSARVDVNRNDEIGVLQRSFNEMADSLNDTIEELENISSMQRRFVSDVSHELRTPVTTIRMAADLLESRKAGFDPTTARTVELLSDQTGRFQSMLADLLEISRYDAGSASADLVSSDIRMPVREAVRDVEDIAKAKGVTIETCMPQRPIFADIDARRIERILRNLLGNAVDFAEDLPVEVHMAANDKAATVSVRDFGTGIAAMDLEHIFDRFWRADTSRSRITGGTGLGLSIALQDARLHHGDLSVRSMPGKGTWFLLNIPLDSGARVDSGDYPVRFADATSLNILGRFLPGETVMDGAEREEGER